MPGNTVFNHLMWIYGVIVAIIAALNKVESGWDLFKIFF